VRRVRDEGGGGVESGPQASSVAHRQGETAMALKKHALLKEQRTGKDEAGKDLYIHLLERT
jgi:hypothetical protein